MVSDAGGRALSIFVCYRREDDPFLPGRLSDSLGAHFGEDNVFYDIDAIQPGFDFREVIRDRLSEVDAVLVLIGREWDTTRLGEPTDFVRTEILEALRMNKLLIPVLVGNTVMPSVEKFPPELERVAYLNAARVRPDPDFDNDSVRLISAIERGVRLRRNELEPEPDGGPELAGGTEPEVGTEPESRVAALDGGTEPHGGTEPDGGDAEADGGSEPRGGDVDEQRRHRVERWKRWRPVVLGGAAAVAIGAVVIGALVLAGGDDVETGVGGDGGDGDASPVEVTVSGTEFWTDTDLDVAEGDRVDVTATGAVIHNNIDSVGPEGFLNRPDLVTPLPTANHAGLLGRITEQGDMFYIGTGTTFTADRSGRLYLGINDGFLGDNAGEFVAQVTVSNDEP